MSAWIKPISERYGGSLAADTAATRDATALTTVAPATTNGPLGLATPGLASFAVIAAAAVVLMAYSTVSVSGSASAKVGK